MQNIALTHQRAIVLLALIVISLFGGIVACSDEPTVTNPQTGVTGIDNMSIAGQILLQGKGTK